MLQGKELRCAIHPVLTSTFIKNKKGTGIKINKPRVMQIRGGLFHEFLERERRKREHR